MSNSLLADRAKELERILAPKLNCYVKVGWAREQNGSELYMVYVDQRASINYSLIPSSWYKNRVDVQLCWPPGVAPPDPFIGPAW